MTHRPLVIAALTASSLAASLLTGCATPPAAAEPPELRSQAPLALDTKSSEAVDWPAARWWEAYGDSTLNGLIGRALQGSPEMASARARFDAARENVRVAGAATGLAVDANASYDRLRLSDNGLLPAEIIGFNWYGQSDLGVGLRYSFDWWGKQRALIESATWQARAADAEQQAARLALASAVATAWFGWQTDSARIQIGERELEGAEKALHVAGLRVSAGLEDLDKQLRLTSERARIRDSLSLLESSRQLRRVTLASLLGVAGDELPPFEPRALPAIRTGIPADARIGLVGRRPDVVASRWRVEAAMQGVRSARAAWYPDISLRALAGLSSIDIGKLLESGSGVPSAGFAISLPLFDGGLRDARYGASRAQVASAISTYDAAVVLAAREVGSAVTMLQGAGERLRHQESQRATAESLLQSARARKREGRTNVLPELEARQVMLEAEDALVQIRFAQLQADIELKQALGGGLIESGETP